MEEGWRNTKTPVADGLSFGMYQLLTSILADTPFQKRLVSAEKLIAALRGVKLPRRLPVFELRLPPLLKFIMPPFPIFSPA